MDILTWYCCKHLFGGEQNGCEERWLNNCALEGQCGFGLNDLNASWKRTVQLLRLYPASIINGHVCLHPCVTIVNTQADGDNEPSPLPLLCLRHLLAYVGVVEDEATPLLAMRSPLYRDQLFLLVNSEQG